MFKAGTLPLNLYRKQPVVPEDRIILPEQLPEMPQEWVPDEERVDENMAIDEEIMDNNNDIDEIQYATDSSSQSELEEIEEQVTIQKKLAFLSGCISCSGRIVKANSKWL